MSRKSSIIICSALFILICTGFSAATVNVNIGVSIPAPPPPLVLPAPPDVFVIPGTYAYFPPSVDVDIVFYGGYWYRPYQGYWYRSGSYNGKWLYIANDRLPHGIRSLPPDWRKVPPGHRHIPYGQMKKSWRSWEREKYWDKHHLKHEEKERHKEHKEDRKRGKHEGKHGRGHGKHDD